MQEVQAESWANMIVQTSKCVEDTDCLYMPRQNIITDKCNLTKGRIYFGSQFEGTVSHGKEGHVGVSVRQLVTIHLQSGSRDGVQLEFLILFSPGSQHGVMLSMGRMSLPTSMDLV